MLSSSRGLQAPLRGFFLAFVLVGGLSGRAQAQARVGVVRAALSIPVQVTIRPRLLMSAKAAPEVVGRTGDLVELEFTFVVAANVDWAMSLALPAGAVVHSFPTVRIETGAWAALTPGSELRVIGRMAPSNRATVRVRVRLPSAEGTRLSEVFRFSIGYADGLPGS